MYLLYAPREKFGMLPPGHPLISEEVRFTQNIAFCPKFYWKKVHCENGCRDITPRFMRRLREKRELKTVTLFATGGLGDSMWSMPFARALKEKHPQVQIVVITEGKNAPLWRGVPYIIATVENAFWNVTGLVRNSDEVYDFGGIATVLKKQKRMDPIEATFNLAGFPLPKEKVKCRPMLVVTIDEGKRMQGLLKSKGIDTKKDTIVSIGLEASTNNRHWPFEYVKELTHALVLEGHKVIWLGKNVEYSRPFSDDTQLFTGGVNLVNQTDIRALMAVVSLSDLYIGPNSGIMVIATALRTPTIGLFGAFNPKLRGKFYERFDYVWGKPDCAPCGEHWTECRKGHPAPCMKLIYPSEVFKKAKDMLKRYPRTLLEKLPIE